MATSPPHKLRWYQFSLRSILVVMTVFALGLGLYIKYVKQDEERRSRITRFCNCVSNLNNVKWLDDSVTLVGCAFSSTNGGDGEVERGKGECVYSLRNATGNEPAKCLDAMQKHFVAERIFHDPPTMDSKDGEVALISSEGRLTFQAKWLPDDPAEGKDVRRMQLQWNFQFQPVFPPSDERSSPLPKR
jgi:hypothetical protein